MEIEIKSVFYVNYEWHQILFWQAYIQTHESDCIRNDNKLQA